jgi:hypothetical protein
MRSCLLLLASWSVAFAGSVEGTVTNATTGEAIKRATVTLMSDAKQVRYIVSADEQGRFQFPNVEAATDYRLEARAPGFMMPPETRQQMKERPPIAVAVQEQVKGVGVKLVALCAITGRVVDSDGDPVRGVSVQALQYQYRGSGRRLDIRASAVTDANGRYRLYYLEPGRYLLRAYLHETPPGPVEPSPHVHNFVPEDGLPPAYYPGTQEAAGASVVQLKPAAELEGYDFHLARTPAYHVRGTVTGADAKTRVMVTPCATVGIEQGTGFTADMLRDGAFDARGVTPGHYCLAVPGGGYKWITAGAQVTVTDRDVKGIALDAPLRVALNGQVEMDPAQSEIPKPLNVRLSDIDLPGGGYGYAQVKDDGTFAMRDVPAGPAAVTLAGKLENAYLKSFRFGDRPAAGRFEVPRTAAKLTLTLGTDAGLVSGKVQDQEGNPGDHMAITLAPRGDLAARTDLIRTAETADDGTFQIKGVAPGEYLVFAWERSDENASRSPEFLKLFESKAGVVTVAASAGSSVQVKSVRAEEMEEATWKEQQ